jgi:hypothetical protein
MYLLINSVMPQLYSKIIQSKKYDDPIKKIDDSKPLK